jgi:hypothetical protein
VIQKIYLNEDKKDVKKVELFDVNEKLLYFVVIDSLQKINKYHVPLKLSVSSDNGNGFKIDVHKYWADVSVNPSMFVLTPQ